MSVGLGLIPLQGPQELRSTYTLGLDRLDFTGDYAIFGQLINMSSRRTGGRNDIPEKPTITTSPIPPQLQVIIHTERGTEYVRKDGYNDGLTFVYAKELKQLRMPGHTSSKNRAIKAFVDALPDDTPIILYWH
ncbi:MAG: hypothetical protein Q7R73_02410 [bacterium]|nr:hypothetical protein [bacterium]